MEKQDVDEKHKQCVRLQVQGKKKTQMWEGRNG